MIQQSLKYSSHKKVGHTRTVRHTADQKRQQKQQQHASKIYQSNNAMHDAGRFALASWLEWSNWMMSRVIISQIKTPWHISYFYIVLIVL